MELPVNTCCCTASVVLHTFEKDTMIFQGPSLNQLGQNPLYKAKKPSFFHVWEKKKNTEQEHTYVILYSRKMQAASQLAGFYTTEGDCLML